MTYKNKLICLFSLIGILVLIYIASFVFSYEMGTTRSAFYTWLDFRSAENATRIVISSEGQEIEIEKRDNQWFIIHGLVEYPARQARIDDFLRIFTARSVWPVRTSNPSSHERFGLAEGACRVTIYSGNSTIFDLMVGNDDIMGNELFLRKAGQNEVRSGDNSIRAYISGQMISWYNLRLIPESDGGNVDVTNIQRLTVFKENETQIFSRANRRWEVSGITVENPDMNAIENFISFVLNAEGESFLDPVYADDLLFDYARFVIEFGNGRIITIRISEFDDVHKRYAQVSNSSHTYIIPLWVSVRLFRDAESFEL
jgi:hypothetical protein